MSLTTVAAMRVQVNKICTNNKNMRRTNIIKVCLNKPSTLGITLQTQIPTDHQTYVVVPAFVATAVNLYNFPTLSTLFVCAHGE
jgi:hypothetical protein